MRASCIGRGPRPIGSRIGRGSTADVMPKDFPGGVYMPAAPLSATGWLIRLDWLEEIDDKITRHGQS
jgi:hypothetical protein